MIGLVTWMGRWRYLWREWFTSIDHKRIGVHYFDPREAARADLQLILVLSLIIALMVAGTLAVLINLRERMT